MSEVKTDKKLNSQALSLSTQLSADNINRSIAYITLVVLIIIAFFVSMANAKFQWEKIFEAQFWIDFSVTSGGGLFLKWIFGRYGNYEGHKNKRVVEATKEIENDNSRIESLGLLGNLKSYIDFNNRKIKTGRIRKKAYAKAFKRPKRKKWQDLKECVKLQEELLELEAEGKEDLETLEKLEEKNFNLESYKIKYPRIKESTLRTGFSSSDTDEAQLSFSEMWELFGKSSLITVLSFAMSILLAVTSVLMEDISLRTFFVFFTRVGIFIMNSYVGFIISKTAVEQVKLNVLKNIHGFLARFIEVSETEVV